MRELSYRNCTVRVDYDEDDAIFFGTVEGVQADVRVYAETVGKLEIAFHKAVDDHLVEGTQRLSPPLPLAGEGRGEGP